MFETRRPRRYKQMVVSPEQVATALFNWRFCRCIQVAEWPDLPEDTQLIDVDVDIQPRCFIFTFWSSEWPEVPLGEIPPRIDNDMVYRVLDLQPSLDAYRQLDQPRENVRQVSWENANTSPLADFSELVKRVRDEVDPPSVSISVPHPPIVVPKKGQ